jgi:hypothetical protein
MFYSTDPRRDWVLTAVYLYIFRDSTVELLIKLACFVLTQHWLISLKGGEPKWIEQGVQPY